MTTVALAVVPVGVVVTECPTWSGTFECDEETLMLSDDSKVVSWPSIWEKLNSSKTTSSVLVSNPATSGHGVAGHVPATCM